MAKNFKNLSAQEQDELKSLIEKKKSKTLTTEDEIRLKELNSKCGFKGGNPKQHDPKKDPKKVGFRAGNDFSWWNKRYDLLKDAANYKCNYVAGDSVAESFDFIIPGVLAVDVIDTFGISERQTDPINIWARDLYLKMFQKYRVANGYSQSDLGITLIATIMVFGLVAFYERIYGIINRYSVLNVNMPFAETRALGLSDATADWLRSHLSDFRYDINELISRAQRICLPRDISLVADKISLYGYEYLDHNSKRSQIVMFRPKYYGTFEDTDLTAGGAVRFNPIDYYDDKTIINKTVDSDGNMCVLLEQALEKLLNSSSVVKMYADLVTWFGEDAMMHLLPVPDEFIIAPVYSESILHKFHNTEAWFSGVLERGEEFFDTLATAARVGMSQADVDKLKTGGYIYQYNDTIISKPVITNTNNPSSITEGVWVYPTSIGAVAKPVVEHLLDTYHEEVTEETITEGVLFKNTMRVLRDSEDEVCSIFTSVAFEVVCQFEFYNTEDSVVVYTGNIFDDDTYKGFAADMALIDWAPLCYFSGEFDNTNIEDIKGDIDNIVMIPNTGLRKLHRAILYSGLQTDVKVIKN